MKKIFAAVGFILPVLAHAALLIPAMIGGQVQQFSADGKVSGCGFTFYGTEKSRVGRVLVFNGSTVLFRNGGALVKGRVSNVDPKTLYSPAFKLQNLKPLKTINVWMKAPNSPATLPVSGISESEDRNYIIYGTNFDSAFPVLRSILEGETIQIGFQVAGKSFEQVMFGAVEISPEEREQLSQCLRELTQ